LKDLTGKLSQVKETLDEVKRSGTDLRGDLDAVGITVSDGISGASTIIGKQISESRDNLGKRIELVAGVISSVRVLGVITVFGVLGLALLLLTR